MNATVSSVLGGWSTFYVITGSSAAALTGLTFVVITLVVGGERNYQSRYGIGTFSTPTLVHFGSAFVISAMLSVPWPSLVDVAAALGVVGLCGVAYGALVVSRMSRRTNYEPDLEDWVCHGILPLVAYVAVFSGFWLPANTATLPFVVAGADLLLIVIGVHNAWDVVTYLAIGTPEGPTKPPGEP